MIDAVIFDMDGVLINTEPVYQDIIGKIYTEIGADVSEEEHLSSLGVDSETWWDHIIKTRGLTGYTPEGLAEIERSRIKDFLESPEAAEAFFEGVEPVLRELKSRGLSLAVASSNHKPLIERVLELGNLRDYFDCIVSATDPDISAGKPEPDLFLSAAGRLGVEPMNCLVVEDSEMGLRAARRAGMHAIAFLSAPAPISTEDADYTFSDYGEFFKKIANLIKN